MNGLKWKQTDKKIVDIMKYLFGLFLSNKFKRALFLIQVKTIICKHCFKSRCMMLTRKESQSILFHKIEMPLFSKISFIT